MWGCGCNRKRQAQAWKKEGRAGTSHEVTGIIEHGGAEVGRGREVEANGAEA
jgi:hypothetical protein